MAFARTNLHFAWRTISRRPALAAAVILPIAFAIAVNTAFSIMDGLLFGRCRSSDLMSWSESITESGVRRALHRQIPEDA